MPNLLYDSWLARSNLDSSTLHWQSTRQPVANYLATTAIAG
jgi:hypothetical protein